ncbi:MAG: hypothetical protein QM485_11840 [Flavobacteriaceae bacterium]
MKKIHFTLFLVAFCLFSSFKPSAACEYAGSNINFVRSQTEKAIIINDINKARYFAYKALNAIEKSKKQLNECGCDYAAKNIEEGLDNLKKAIKATTLNSTRILLKRALENTLGSLEALEKHDLHNSNFASDVLVLNTVEANTTKTALKRFDMRFLHQKIDESLLNYQESLNTIINTVNCKEAKAYADKVFNHCETQLLKPNLSEGKKYYNLKTKQITAKALASLGECLKR